MNDIEIEKEIVDKGLVAPRVTLDDLNNNIADVEYLKHVTKGGGVLRWAIITTKNGYTVTGKPSAAVSVENDDKEIGVKIAYQNAVNKLWPLMGYALKESLTKAE